MRLRDGKFVFFGAGEANLGAAALIVKQLMMEGMSETKAKEKIFLIDSKGLVVLKSPNLSPQKKVFAKDMERQKDLVKIIEMLKPTALIGASAVGKVFTRQVIESMSQVNERPIIFALSNPTHKSECTAEEAYVFSGKRAIFASGSPFDQVSERGSCFHLFQDFLFLKINQWKPGQANNSYIFPGVALAAVYARTNTIPDEYFIIAANTVADMAEEGECNASLCKSPHF